MSNTSYASDPMLGAYLKKINHDILTPEAEKSLAVKSRNGDVESRNILARSNLRLVISIAKRFQGRGLSFMDLIEEGNVGLMDATERFDAKFNVRFSSYATWWIEAKIKEAIVRDSSAISVPPPVYRRVKKLNAFFEDNPNASLHEAATALGLSEKQTRSLLHTPGNPISMHKENGDLDFPAESIGGTSNTVFDSVSELNLKTRIYQFIEELSSQQRKVLYERFGINDGEHKTLATVGKKLGISTEYVRLIQNDALKILSERLNSSPDQIHN
jgi:RNA polymerase primary sigma factor